MSDWWMVISDWKPKTEHVYESVDVCSLVESPLGAKPSITIHQPPITTH